MARLLGGVGPLFAFMTQSTWARRRDDTGAADFVLGNPHEMPLPGFVRALQHWSTPEDKDWFAYKMSEPAAQAAAARSLRERRGIDVAPEDVYLTNGAFAALAVGLAAVVDPGDEVVFLSPPWFFYETLIAAGGATAVRVQLQPPSFDLDPAAIAAAITPRTRALIVNSPHNPSGRVYGQAALAELGRVLAAASERNGRPIYLLSDEAYSRIVYGSAACPSPTSFYPHAFLVYTYGKTLLTPGQRIGYLALPAGVPDRAALRPAIMLAQLTTGYAFPNALLQHALGDLEQLSVDVAALERRRDRVVAALRGIGYETNMPEATFYVLVRSPLADDLAFAEQLAEHGVFVLPGSLFELPGYLRISLTASDQMVDHALPGFAAAWASANAAT
jgi:aspartate aminotransferase